MYNQTDVLGAAVAPTVAAVVLPNTGAGSNVVMLAVAVLAGLSVWAVAYRRSNR